MNLQQSKSPIKILFTLSLNDFCYSLNYAEHQTKGILREQYEFMEPLMCTLAPAQHWILNRFPLFPRMKQYKAAILLSCIILGLQQKEGETTIEFVF